jgi:predicted metal-binding membrane protein
MMAVMMLPLTWPWLSALARLSATAYARPPSIPTLVVPAFVAGYLSIWLAYSVGAAALQMLLLARGSATPALTTTILAAAGVYQLTPAKAACLKHCRSPLALILSRWPIRPGGALRLGAEHGIFCVGCCWVLMLIGLGAGAVTEEKGAANRIAKLIVALGVRPHVGDRLPFDDERPDGHRHPNQYLMLLAQVE